MANVNSAENISEQLIVAQTKVMNKTVQQCLANNSQSESVTIYNVNGTLGPTIDNTTINFNEVASLDINCMSSANFQTNIVDELTQSAQQLAKSLTQNASLNVASSSSVNLATAIAKASIAVYNESYQTCVQNAFQSEGLTIHDATGTVINNSVINFNETLDSVINCTLNQSSTTTASTTISQTLSQIAESLTSNALALIALAVIAVCILFFFLEFEVVQSLLNWKTLTVIGVFIIIYLLLAWWLGFWPFPSKKSSSS